MNKLTFWIRIKSLQKKRDSVYKEFKKAELKAIEDKLRKDDLHELAQVYSSESFIYEMGIHDVYTEFLRKKAEELMLPLPDYSDDSYWDEPYPGANKYLTEKGITKLRSDIRTESHERRAGILIWIASITGLVGAITGLIAIITTIK